MMFKRAGSEKSNKIYSTKKIKNSMAGNETLEAVETLS